MKYMAFWKDYENLDEVIDDMHKNYCRPFTVLIYNSYVFVYNNTIERCKDKKN